MATPNGLPRRTFLKALAAGAAGAALGRTNGAAAEAAAPAISGPFQPAWPSLAAHAMPEWLVDAKFGIYAHWGLYAVPAFGNEWYAKRMYEKGNAIYKFHVEKYGDPSKFGYKDFVPLFKAERYDPDAWAALIASSGARYAGLAAVHHDGFLLWDSAHSRWNAKQMGPKRDLYGDLAAALRRRGLKVLATEHHFRTFNWYLPGADGLGVIKDLAKTTALVRDAGYDLADPKCGDLYWNEVAGRTYADFLVEWQAKVRELIDKYQPDVFWFDGGDFRGKAAEKVVLDLLAHYHNRAAAGGKPVEVLNKLGGNGRWNFDEAYGIYTFEEGRDRPARVDRPWIDDMKISDVGWGYLEGQKYKAAAEVLHGLIDRTARGGGLLLNLSPKPDGTIPDAQQAVLRQVGAWLKASGEAVFATRPWAVYAEGDEAHLHRGRFWVFDKCTAADIRFTQSKDGKAVYVTCLGTPTADVRVKSLGKSSPHAARPVAAVTLLGSADAVPWSQEADALVIKAGGLHPPCPEAAAFKVTF